MSPGRVLAAVVAEALLALRPWLRATAWALGLLLAGWSTASPILEVLR